MTGPKKMKVYIPEIIDNISAIYKEGNTKDNIHWKYKNQKNTKIKKLINKEPTWSESKSI